MQRGLPITTLGGMNLVKDITKDIVIHGFSFDSALKESLRVHCDTLGKQTNVVHISDSSARKYVWAHRNIQPWGRRLPTQCPRCGVLNPWKIPVYIPQDESYRIRCHNDGCGAGQQGGFQDEIKRPEGVELIKGGGGGLSGWLKHHIL